MARGEVRRREARAADHSGANLSRIRSNEYNSRCDFRNDDQASVGARGIQEVVHLRSAAPR